MAWTFTEDAADLLAAAGEFLLSRPVEHTIELRVAAAVRQRGSDAFGAGVPLFGWWQTAPGPVECAFLHTPPFPCLLAGPARQSRPGGHLVGEGQPHGDRQSIGKLAGQYLRELAGQLASLGHSLPGVNSAEGVAMAFAAAWQQRTGAKAKASLRSRLYRLGNSGRQAPGRRASRESRARRTVNCLRTGLPASHVNSATRHRPSRARSPTGSVRAA